jgi:hypothetical protein
LQVRDPFGWHEIERGKIDDIRQKLIQFEGKSWNEILIKGKRWNHSVLVDDLCKDAKDRLLNMGQDDVEELVTLHLSGLERIWGIRDMGVLKLLWWDPYHQVCPSLKKHT